MNETIAQMQEQSDQTGRLADNAGTQATQAKLLAGDTHNLWIAAMDQATATGRMFTSEKNVNRAWVAAKGADYVDDVQVTRNCPTCPVTKEDHFIEVRLQLTNFGRSTAVHVKFRPSYYYFAIWPKDTLPPR